MEVLVWSDSHGHKDYVMRMLDKEPECKNVFFLGDGLDEALSVQKLYPDRKFYLVKGNNDRQYDAQDYAYAHIDGVTFMACHGHRLSVDITLRYLYDKAEAVRGHVALYGHTHVANVRMDSMTGVCAINPGAMNDGKYCVVTVNKGDYTVKHKEIW